MAFGLKRYSFVCAWPAEFYHLEDYWPRSLFTAPVSTGTMNAGLRYLATLWLVLIAKSTDTRYLAYWSGDVTAAVIFFTSLEDSDWSRHTFEWEPRTITPSSPPDELKYIRRFPCVVNGSVVTRPDF